MAATSSGAAITGSLFEHLAPGRGLEDVGCRTARFQGAADERQGAGRVPLTGAARDQQPGPVPVQRDIDVDKGPCSHAAPPYKQERFLPDVVRV
jgi:hypothetical protein